MTKTMHTMKIKSLLASLVFCYFSISPVFAWQFICPGDITLPCDADLHDLNLYGKSYTEHNGYKSWLHDCKVVYNLNDCGVGTITRTWGVEDTLWRWVTCSQVITLTNVNVFTPKDIYWPDHLTIESCDPDADFKNLAKPYDHPYFTKKVCTRPMYTYSDSWFQVDSGCRKLLREWKLIDWCTYDPFSPAPRGIFTYTQIIKLITNDPAIHLVVKKDTTVFATTDCKGVYLKYDSAKIESQCRVPHRIINTSQYSDKKEADISGYYPIGMHKVELIAEYACGKEIKCIVTINVVQKIPPVPYCLDGAIIDLMPIDTDGDGKADEGMIEVNARDLDKSSYHPCPGRKLKFSFSSDTSQKSKIYTCDDVGENQVEIWITDDLGNQSFCKTKIEIQRNMIDSMDCGKTTVIDNHVDLSLKMKDQFGKMEKMPRVFLMENSTNQKMVCTSNSTKQELIFENLKKTENYSIDLSECEFDFNKLDIRDVSALKNILAGKSVDPIVLLAADMNLDNRVDKSDLDILSNLILSKNKTSNDLWQLIPSDIIFTNPSNPWLDLNSSYKSIHLIGNETKSYYLIQKGNIDPKFHLPSVNDDFVEVDVNPSPGYEVSIVQNRISINSKNELEQFNFELIDLCGKKLIKSICTGNCEIEIPKVQEGVYLYRITGTTQIDGKIFLLN